MGQLHILETIDIFSDLSPEQIDRVEQICKEVIFMRGEYICYENSPSSEFYIILEGEVEIQVDPSTIRAGKAGQGPRTIAVLRQGQTFGEVTLVDQGLRSASGMCSTMTCRLLEINRDEFIGLLESDYEMGYKVMSRLAADLSFKIRQSNLNLREALLSASTKTPIDQ